MTEAKRELGEYDRDVLDRKLRMLQEWQGSQPEISVTYFRPDARKEGGEYVTVSGRLKKIKIYDGVLILADGCSIAFDDIAEISGGMLDEF